MCCREYNPKLPCASKQIDNMFALKFSHLCSAPEAFHKYKANGRDTLELNKEMKAKTSEKRSLEIEKIKMICRL
jgi:hypothetical protein